MKHIQIKRMLIAGLIAYTLGVTAFLLSYMIPVMSNPEEQANLVLAIAIVPAAMIGAHYYYRLGPDTNSFLLGASMFVETIFLDAIITVPIFVIPAGGDYISFFTDPGFWIIGLEYVLAVVAYRARHLFGIFKRKREQV